MARVYSVKASASLVFFFYLFAETSEKGKSKI